MCIGFIRFFLKAAKIGIAIELTAAFQLLRITVNEHLIEIPILKYYFP